jgi:uncharacterized protein (TIGR02266 family)
MTNDTSELNGGPSSGDDVVEIDLNFESMRRFQAEFSPNLCRDGLFIDTAEPLDPGSVIRFRVVLPEDFIFLEGTAVVEWIRAAEDAAAGPAGMALRFASLSPQNQELVEQLVRDYGATGGDVFDLDVRPVPTDFPTDALEGAPATPTDDGDEAYRLTIRNTGAAAHEDALRALAEAGPAETGEPAAGDTSEQTDDGPERDEGVIGEPPELDLADDEGLFSAEDATKAAVVVESDESGLSAAESGPDDASDELAPAVDEPDPETDPTGIELPAPADFDDGPERLGDLGGEFEGRQFDVSLPDSDDEPDTTPVMPDDGRDDVTVPPPENDIDGGTRPSPLRFLVPAAILVAVAAGAYFGWPAIRGLLSASGEPAGSSVIAELDPTPSVDTTMDQTGETAIEPAVESSDDAVEPPVDDASEPGNETADLPPGDRAAHADIDAEPVPQPEPDSAPAPEPEPVTDRVASRVDEITADPETGRTVVAIRADGNVEDGVISVEKLTAPPRILVRVRGITAPFRPYTIETTTAEVARIRIGHHESRRPPELWVVLDLTRTDVELDAVDLDGGVARIAVAGP